MRKGLKALDDAIADSAKGGGSYKGRLGFFNVKAGETITLRFLTDLDDTVTCDFYEFIQDNKDKGQNFVVSTDYYDEDAPDSVRDKSGNIIDWVKELGGKQVDYQTKDLVDPQPKTKTVAIAVVKKEVVSEGPKGRPVTSSEDLWEEVEAKGPDGNLKKYEARKYIVIRQAYKNFWQPLRDIYDEYGTICDRDYRIKRLGEKLDTSYGFVGRKEDPEWDPETSYAALQEAYGYGTDKSDVPDDERFAYCPQTLEEWLEDSCSEDRVKFFLGPLSDREAKEKGNKPDAETTTTTSTANDDSDEGQAAPPPSANGKAASGSLAARLAAHK